MEIMLVFYIIKIYFLLLLKIWVWNNSKQYYLHKDVYWKASKTNDDSMVKNVFVSHVQTF